MEACLKCHICGAVINEDALYAALEAFDLEDPSDEDFEDFEELTDDDETPSPKCMRVSECPPAYSKN